jgi:Flp pilus assembly protein TadD
MVAARRCRVGLRRGDGHGSGLIGADRAEARAASLAAAKAPWSVVRAELARAESLAPWEAQIVRARGTIATAVLGRRFDSAVAVDGIEAFDAAVAMTPADAVLASERGNLMLAAGLTAKDSGLLKRAIATFAEAERMDPNTGIAMAGRASALLALGRTDQTRCSSARFCCLRDAAVAQSRAGVPDCRALG